VHCCSRVNPDFQVGPSDRRGSFTSGIHGTYGAWRTRRACGTWCAVRTGIALVAGRALWAGLNGQFAFAPADRDMEHLAPGADHSDRRSGNKEKSGNDPVTNFNAQRQTVRVRRLVSGNVDEMVRERKCARSEENGNDTEKESSGKPAGRRPASTTEEPIPRRPNLVVQRALDREVP
jgi:hypothetical protein